MRKTGVFAPVQSGGDRSASLIQIDFASSFDFRRFHPGGSTSTSPLEPLSELLAHSRSRLPTRVCAAARPVQAIRFPD